ncbi:MAG: cobalamin biosynthesis protein CobD [Elusimicrobia bacterium RIFCSPLOWO2_02_FULL_39_32]|nr:MAG: cobalamin biosynthesis protein CobD [Elusimicrobia bacterium GWA2_38_7]OGR79220.1 MAG: cobalamin biosynthesis protein CobD [Elusimicrobia bacterium RIFCSPHIGHO2_02_FULL_39_36]OGR93121.1 MAG: cobalamin biosynthesis protein CobD [Elusimicrobia bacterium RIFCSPLOWO2_02_FULL_39_32]OGR99345.1 MAG: cobalamin biosynthesis protein CobD [Elusimicrobia bacterium RIFCSPLOWO2_12_FULL_39_28]
MNFIGILIIAYLLDLLLGDPDWMPHPIRFIGFLIEKGENAIRKGISSEKLELLGGTFLTIGMISLSFLVPWMVLKILFQHSPACAVPVEIFLLYACFSTKELAIESFWVRDALKSNDIPLARKKLSWIVGRDTKNLDEKEIIRGTVETVAESTVDGIIAPVFYACLGGAPLALTYKTINTLDSMIGHKNKKYFYFGKTAAKIDTLANWLPARISGFLFPIAAGILGYSSKSSYQIAWGQGLNTPVPNAAIPEAAMAGALQIQLGGLNTYENVPLQTPYLGSAEKELSVEHIDKSIKLMFVGSLLFFLICLTIRTLWGITFIRG